MITLRSRRAALAVPIAAVSLLMLGAPAHAGCMTDDKGIYHCSDEPTSGPGPLTGFNGVHDGTPGAPGPDGQPLAAPTQPAWMQPGYVPPPVPASALPARNEGGSASFTPPPPVKAPAYVAPPAAVEKAPAAPATGSADQAAAKKAAENAAAAAASASASPTASPSSAASGPATPAPTMTERSAAAPIATATESAPESVKAARASRTERFNPVPLVVGIAAALAAAGIFGSFRACGPR